MFKSSVVLISIIFLVYGCNKNLTDAEKKELWSKAQTTGEIINRSGTTFNADKNKQLALDDAQNRLRTGGGLFGPKGNLEFLGSKKESEKLQTLA